MNTNKRSADSIYQLKPALSFYQIYDAVSDYLAKAEALATTAANIDFEAFSSWHINNYFWALSDLIQEARCACEKLTTSPR